MTRSSQLVEILNTYGISATVVSVITGPILTSFEIDIENGTKLSKLVGIKTDIARLLSVESVNISRVDGKPTLYVEIPNIKKNVVRFSDFDNQDDNKTSFLIGTDTFGEPIYGDLKNIPHLLISGTSGSGKSVTVNSIIASLLKKNSPEDMKLVLIDPKMVEFSSYNGINNLYSPVITDMNEAVDALSMIVSEMEDRFKRMSSVGAKNIDSYNSTQNDKLFRIVVVVDEYADLVCQNKNKVEGLVQRISQMARAAGIHLILATQRPSADVISGTIKANFLNRLVFKAATTIDSRVMLATTGAESLLGNGDMIMYPSMKRVHGVYISDEEIGNVVENSKLEYGTFVSFQTKKISVDEKINKVLKNYTKISASKLHLDLDMKYKDAMVMIEKMFKSGLIGKPSITGQYQVL